MFKMTDADKYTHGISVITAVKNRISNFKNSFKIWLQNKDIDQIVVVDWDSDDGLFEFVDKIDDARVTFVRIENQPFWCLTKAFNLASRFVKYDKIVKIDADVSISSDFFQKFELRDGIFLAGNWESTGDENEMNLNGLVYLNTSDYLKVNGYNEHIQTYGWDDCDFYERLVEVAKLERNDIMNESDRCYAIHSPHGDRMEFHPHKYKQRGNTKIELSHTHEIRKNQKIASFKTWGIENEMMDVEIARDDGVKIYRVSEIVDTSGKKPHIPLACAEYSHEGQPQPTTKFAWINQLEDELIHEWELYGAWEYDQKNFVIPNVFDADEATDEFTAESTRRKGYLGEIENRLKEAYASMIRENDNVRYVKPLDVDYDKLSTRYDKIKLIVQYYDMEIQRKNEIDFAFEKNLENPLIDEVHVLVESESVDLSGWDSAKIVKKNIGKRLTYDECFQYARDNFDESDVALVCNIDCYFNESVGKLKKVNFNDKLICMTRKDLSENGKLMRPANPEVENEGHRFDEIHEITTNRCLDYDSSDAWAFSTKLSRFSSNIELGTYSCEYFLHTSAINDGIKVRNVAEYVDCIHVHGTNYRNRYAVENELSQLPNRMYEGRVSGNAIDGVWRVRSPENYIDENSSQHEYTDYVVRDFKELCE